MFSEETQEIDIRHSSLGQRTEVKGKHTTVLENEFDGITYVIIVFNGVP